MGVLTYLDGIENEEILTKTKLRLTDHFHSEIDEAATIFCLPFLHDKMYSTEEISKLASFLSDMRFHHLSWRATQPYVLIRDFKDVTPRGRVKKDEKCNRDIVLEGYLRGCNNIKKGAKVHIAGVGDFPLFQITRLNDPFPLPGKESFKIKGVRTGTYLRLKVRDVPSEMVENPCHPILVGGIGIEEENAGYMQATLMRHNWHNKLLKTKDPIIVSIGWRRYQTHPIYAMEHCRGQLQMLGCTPKDKQCITMFWGPLAPPSTGVVVVQSLADHEAAFRILATGIVHDNNQAKKVFKNHLLSKTVKVPCVFQPLLTALKPRDRIWKYIGPADELTELSESVEEHFEAMRDTEAPELKEDEIETLQRLLKEDDDMMGDSYDAGRRETLEQQRAVLIVEGEPRARTSLYGFFHLQEGDGTTVVVFHNRSGVTMVSDGYAFVEREDITEDTPVAERRYLSSTTSLKTFVIGNRLLVGVSGCRTWVHVLHHLLLVAHLPEWTSKRCANFAHFFMNSTTYVPPPELYGQTEPEYMTKYSSKMMFSSLDEGRTRVFVANKDRVFEVVNDSEYKGGSISRWKDDFGRVEYHCMGSGSKAVNNHMLENRYHQSKTVEDNQIALMRLVEVGVLGDKHTGGAVDMHHLSPTGTISRVPQFHADEIKGYFEAMNRRKENRKENSSKPKKRMLEEL